MKFLILASVSLLIFSSYGQAQVVFSPGLAYLSDTQEQTDPTSSNVETSQLRADIRLGYILPMGLYVGGMYAYNSVDVNGTDSTGFLAGPSVGYHSMMGFYTMLTYHILGETGDTTKFTGAKGPPVDIGWVFPLTSSFALGPQITYRSVEFDKIETAGSSIDTDLKQTSIAPYLSLWFMF